MPYASRACSTVCRVLVFYRKQRPGMVILTADAPASGCGYPKAIKNSFGRCDLMKKSARCAEGACRHRPAHGLSRPGRHECGHAGARPPHGRATKVFTRVRPEVRKLGHDRRPCRLLVSMRHAPSPPFLWISSESHCVLFFASAHVTRDVIGRGSQPFQAGSLG